jgi:hypothetical protein
MSAAEGLWPVVDEQPASSKTTNIDEGPATTDDAFFFAPGPAVGGAEATQIAANLPTGTDDDFFFAPATAGSETELAGTLFSGQGEAEPSLFEQTAAGEEAPSATSMGPSSMENSPTRASHHRLSIRAMSGRAGAKRARAEAAAIGKLARAVDGLRELEGQMFATLEASEKTLRTLGSKQIYQDAGFGSFAEIQARMLQAAPMLQALRVSTRRPSLLPAPGASFDRTRSRTTRALFTVSRVLQRLRFLEGRIQTEARKAQGALRTIEHARLYEECGYTSFEDFLERALGPSPLLSSAVALVEDPSPSEPPEASAQPEAAPSPILEPELIAEPDAWLTAPPEIRIPSSQPRELPPAALEPPTSSRALAAVAPAASSEEAPQAAAVETGRKVKVRPRWLTHAALTVTLALIATGIGAVTGRVGTNAARVPDLPDASVLGLVEPASPSELRAPQEAGRTPAEAPASDTHAAKQGRPDPSKDAAGKDSTAKLAGKVGAPDTTTDTLKKALDSALKLTPKPPAANPRKPASPAASRVSSAG